MAELRSDFLRTVTDRGYVHQCTDFEALDTRALAGPIPAYIGFDATAESLHAGSLTQIMLLRRLQQTGHKPIVLMGGGTTKIGDPSGKDEARKLLDDAQIDHNIAGIFRVFEKFLTFGEGPTDAVMVNNADWLDTLQYIPLLREVGPHFTINRMLTFDSVRLRLDREQPLTFLEFNYMILQAYDFVELARRHACVLQMGGSDQWGNIVNGVELGRRMDGRQLFGLTSPLLTTASGAKMGKTAAGAIWLNEDHLSAYEYYQYWRNVEDADAGKFLALFTDLPMDEVTRLGALAGQEVNEAKKVLAFEATKMCHGEAAAEKAAQAARQTFEQGARADDLPSVELAAARFAAGVAVYELLREAGLVKSNGEGRRLIKGGGARLNDAVVDDENRQATAADLEGGALKLSAGRKRHVLVRAV